MFLGTRVFVKTIGRGGNPGIGWEERHAGGGRGRGPTARGEESRFQHEYGAVLRKQGQDRLLMSISRRFGKKHGVYSSRGGPSLVGPFV